MLLILFYFNSPGLKPGAMEPGAMEPGAMEPGAIEPGAMEPGAMEPEAINFIYFKSSSSSLGQLIIF
jgi:hypothetical protein